jgi:hypothetical protein
MLLVQCTVKSPTTKMSMMIPILTFHCKNINETYLILLYNYVTILKQFSCILDQLYGMQMKLTLNADNSLKYLKKLSYLS